MSLIREVPVFGGQPAITDVCAGLRAHGLVVVDATRMSAAALAHEAEQALGVDHDGDDSRPFLLHLSAPVDPGWVDYLVLSSSFPSCPLRAKRYVAAATDSWRRAGEPRFHLARVRD